MFNTGTEQKMSSWTLVLCSAGVGGQRMILNGLTAIWCPCWLPIENSRVGVLVVVAGAMSLALHGLPHCLPHCLVSIWRCEAVWDLVSQSCCCHWRKTLWRDVALSFLSLCPMRHMRLKQPGRREKAERGAHITLGHTLVTPTVGAEGGGASHQAGLAALLSVPIVPVPPCKADYNSSLINLNSRNFPPLENLRGCLSPCMACCQLEQSWSTQSPLDLWSVRTSGQRRRGERRDTTRETKMALDVN